MPELTWIRFLRILDELEAHEQDDVETVGQAFTPLLDIIAAQGAAQGKEVEICPSEAQGMMARCQGSTFGEY